MIPISSVSAGGTISSTPNTLTWIRGQRKRSYELILNGEVVGRMERLSFWSADCAVETADGRWTFRQAGFFGRSEIVDESSRQTIATMKSTWGTGGGTLTFADGQKFEFMVEGWWRQVWSVTPENGPPVLRLDARERSLELAGGSEAVTNRLSLLAMFAYYRVIRTEEDQAAVLAVV
jgi:hypothetical protein